MGSAIGSVFGSGFGMGQGAADASGALNKSVIGNPNDDMQKQQFLAAIAASQQGINQNMTQEQALAQQLQLQAAGQGPNPALQELNQATNRNIQQGAGMIASQKGINPALAARMASQNTAMANQQAAGQAASLGAHQQLAAQGQMGQLYGQLGNQNQNYQALLQQANQSQNALMSQNSLASQGMNANIAAGNAATRGAINSSLVGGFTGLAALGGRNMAGGNNSGTGSMGGGGGQGSYASSNNGSGGSEDWTSMSKGGMANGPKSFAGKHLHAHNMKKGGHVPGKSQVKGDSLKNDTVPAMLSPGEIVIPRTKANDPDAARKFVAAILAKKGM